MKKTSLILLLLGWFLGICPMWAQSVNAGREVSAIRGIGAYSPKNANTRWYTTSAEAAGAG